MISVRRNDLHICVANIIRLNIAITVSRCIYQIQRGPGGNIKEYSVHITLFNEEIDSITLKIIDIYLDKDFNHDKIISIGNIGLILVSTN